MGADSEAVMPVPGQPARDPEVSPEDTGAQEMAVATGDSLGSGDFQLVRGASWITPEGVVHRIRGFHDRWIQEHPELARGSRTTVELILATGWASVSLYETGALEIILPSLSQHEGLRHAASILERNPGSWSEARIFCLDAAGCVMVEADAILAAEDACTELRRLVAAGAIAHST